MTSLCFIPSIQLKNFRQSRSKSTTKFAPVSARLDNSQQTTNQQLNLSVIRFTLGIPGLDESYLPRWIGYGFGSFLLLNHFVGSDSVTPAQLRTEAGGLALAAFSVTLPYIGKFLKGADIVDQTTLPQGAEQIFVMSQNLLDTEKEDLAWATYSLLRSTNTTAVMISVNGELCIRGYWNTEKEMSKAQMLDWFGRKIQNIGLSDLKDTLYFPQLADSGFWEILPQETRSVLVQPILNTSVSEMGRVQGFILLASNKGYAYNDKDRAWVAAIANKFKGCKHI